MCLLLAVYGVFIGRSFAKCDFLLAYRGDLVDAMKLTEEVRIKMLDVSCIISLTVH